MSENGELVGEEEAREELVSEATQLQGEIVRGVQAVHTAWLYVAAKVHRFMEGEMWRRLGYASQNEWLASPEIDKSRSTVLMRARVYRELVVDRGVPVDALKGVDLKKIEIGLAAIAGGEHWQTVVADAKALTRPDMQKQYRQPGGRQAPIAPESEPECQSCPMCGSWVEKDRIPEEERAA